MDSRPVNWLAQKELISQDQKKNVIFK
ncbi:hypothetical protein [Bacillus sp. PK3_68]|nr:hypothetical protein [Bacillus sp. PK3_68]